MMKNKALGKIIPTTTVMLIPVILILLLNIVGFCKGGTTSYNVIKTEQSVDIPLEHLPPPPGYNAPEQVHITQGDHEGRAIIVSWVTPLEPGLKSVKYWKANGDYKHKSEAHGQVNSYTYCNYKSGYIHHATIRNLEYDTKYVYEVGSGHVTRKFYFTTPPPVGPDVPYNFGIIGDLGQTFDSNQTLEHYISNPKGQTVLYLGDLSYADHYPLGDNRRWDSWGRFVEKSVAYQPWIWTAGNHELEFLPNNGETVPFKPFMNRYRTPYKASKSTSQLWYSIKRASAYIIVLSSYSPYAYTEQWLWFYQELKKVNREETPWLIVLFHTPIYSSNAFHYTEGETMRLFFETLLVRNKVDIIPNGHVHAYERSERISKIGRNITNGLSTPDFDQSAPVYMVVGDGGNIEGHADQFIEPQPSYSAYRESSYGHAMFEIKNRTHAYFAWYRNQDDEAVVGDSLWLHNRYWFPTEESSSTTTKA